MTSGTQAILSELTRVKVGFQARTIAAVIGAPPPDISALFRHDFDPNSFFCRVCRYPAQDEAEGILQECKP